MNSALRGSAPSLALSLIPILHHSITSPLSVADKNGDDAQQDKKQNDDQRNEAVAGHPFLITQRTKSLDSARGQVTDQFWIGRGRASKLIAQPAQQRRQIILPDAQFIVMFRRGRSFGQENDEEQ